MADKKNSVIINSLWIVLTFFVLFCFDKTVLAYTDEVSEINYNQYYNMSDLVVYDHYLGYQYIVNVKFPKEGRAKIIIEDCSDNIANEWDYSGGTSGIRTWRESVFENKDSGWVTVKEGCYQFCVDSKNKYQKVNPEAKILIRYQEIGEYYGETEDNNTFDTATKIINN